MENEIRILSLEDSAFDAELIEREFRNAKMPFTMKRVETREDFVKAIDDFKPTVVLLDYNLPSFDGISALDIARQKCLHIPAIFVSGAIGEERAVETLKRGAADYIMKDRLLRLVPALNRAIHEYEEKEILKQTEETLKENEEKFRTITETATDAIICLKSPGVINLWNKKAEEMFGYPAAEALGRDMHALIVPERYHEKAREGLTAFFQAGTGAVVGKTIELYALRRDGAEFPIELSISPMQIRGEWQATGIVRDITERKQSEEKLKQQVEELERFKKATIQREIRMKELRDKLEKFKE